MLDLMRPLANRRSPLTHTSHCMTTNRPAAATQMRARASPAMHPKVFLCHMSFLFPGLETSPEYVGLHILRLGYNRVTTLYEELNSPTFPDHARNFSLTKLTCNSYFSLHFSQLLLPYTDSLCYHYHMFNH